MNTFVPQGLYTQTSKQIATTLRTNGWNCVRLNWSLELFYTNPLVSYEAIKALLDAGLYRPGDQIHALDVFDRVVADLASEKIMIILDNHMSDAGW